MQKMGKKTNCMPSSRNCNTDLKLELAAAEISTITIMKKGKLVYQLFAGHLPPATKKKQHRRKEK